MTRVKTGWRLAKESWALLRADRTLVLFPLLSTVFVTIALALTLTPGLIGSEALDQDWFVLPFMVVGGYASTFFVVYFNVALAATARVSMDGGVTELRHGLRVARERRGVIAQWALLQFTLGVLTRVVARLMGESVAASLVSIFLSFAAVAWTIATFFAVPLIALEGLGPSAALKRSASLVRQRWGEGLVGTAAISTAVLLVAALPLFMLFNFASALADVNQAVGGGFMALAAIAFIAVATTASALNVIFRVALYRFSTEKQPPSGFSREDMVAAFRPA